MSELYRVLKSGGIARLVVPDLENITRTYLSILDGLLENNTNTADYDWIMLELYDQVVRGEGGGDMGHYLSSPDITNKEFILSRIGQEAKYFFNRENMNYKRPILQKISSNNFF
jgi:hypothetical protein